ncbi:MAG: ester cyclase [Chitinophagales bacterium]
MKKLFFPVAVISLCFFMSCNNGDAGKMSAQAQKNLDAANAINKMFETNDWGKVGDYIATDAVDHAGAKGDVKGLDSIKAEFAEFGKTMSNMKNVTVKALADDDYVFQWNTETWTMNVDEMGMKAGSTHTADAIEVSKFNKDGKVAEHWSFISYTDMMKMMQQPPMMDSTKHK